MTEPNGFLNFNTPEDYLAYVSPITLESLRFFTIPTIFNVSKQMVWFSRTSLVESFCWKSVLISVILWYCLATLILALFLLLEPFCFLLVEYLKYFEYVDDKK